MVITVGRQYGSGGREIGTMLAKQLGIAYYDDMLLKEAAEESGLCEELFRSFDERPKSFLYSIAMDPYSFSMNHVTPKGSIEQQVYLATYDTIKKLADKGPCVLIGRCADYALKDRDDVINLFITAPLENRIKRVAARNGISENEAKDRIKKTDKSRASYYNYYSAKDWMDSESARVRSFFPYLPVGNTCCQQAMGITATPTVGGRCSLCRRDRSTMSWADTVAATSKCKRGPAQ